MVLTVFTGSVFKTEKDFLKTDKKICGVRNFRVDIILSKVRILYGSLENL